MALAEIEQTMGGKWILEKNDNLDEYLKDLGVNFFLRKIALAASGTFTLSVEGDSLRFVTTGPKNSDHMVKLDEEFEDTDPIDNPMRVTVTWDSISRVLTTSARPAGAKGKEQKVERQVVDGKLIMKIYMGNIAAQRIFKR